MPINWDNFTKEMLQESRPAVFPSYDNIAQACPPFAKKIKKNTPTLAEKIKK